jgi:hypothetical protein
LIIQKFGGFSWLGPFAALAVGLPKKRAEVIIKDEIKIE